MSMDETSEFAQKALYSVTILCIIFCFYKLSRKQERNFGLLMILILLVTLFMHAIIQLLNLFGRSNDYIEKAGDVLNNFASLWIISLAVYHYSLLTFFKGKFREYPFKTFIIRASLGSLSIGTLTELEYVKKWNASFYLIDVLSVLVLFYICYKTYCFQNQIKFGPYSIVRGSAHSLIKFTLIQACFACLEIIVNLISYYSGCPNNQKVVCAASNVFHIILYQSWVWYVVYYNWKWIRAFEVRELENAISNYSSDLNNSISSGAFIETHI